MITHARIHFVLQTSEYHRISRAWVANKSVRKWIYFTGLVYTKFYYRTVCVIYWRENLHFLAFFTIYLDGETWRSYVVLYCCVDSGRGEGSSGSRGGSSRSTGRSKPNVAPETDDSFSSFGGSKEVGRSHLWFYIRFLLHSKPSRLSHERNNILAQNEYIYIF